MRSSVPAWRPTRSRWRVSPSRRWPDWPFSQPAMRAALLVVAAAGIQLRLLCNLLDGMVAVEGGRGTKSGEVFNDAPDRLADVLIFVGAGYALRWPDWGSALGWAAAVVAVLTAYVRILG